jgi:phage protein D
MTLAGSTRTSGLPEGYYAPGFLVRVNGKPLEPVLVGDVREVKVVLSIKDLATVDLTMNNYDQETFDLKYSDSDLFSIDNPVYVELGYADRLVPMISGRVTTLSPAFLADGSTTLGVRVVDALKDLKDSFPPKGEGTYRGTEYEIVKQVADRHGMQIEPPAGNGPLAGLFDPGPTNESVVQGKKDDLTFVKERAARIGNDVYIAIDPRTTKDRLFFGPPRDGSNPQSIRTFVMSWGSLRSTAAPPNILEFKPTVTSHNQVKSVTVCGWDSNLKRAIQVTEPPDDDDAEASKPVAKATGKPAPKAAAKPGATPKAKPAAQPAAKPAAAKPGEKDADKAGDAGKGSVVIDAPVASVDEARALAKALLKERTYEFLTGSVKTIGLPELRAGDNVEIGGVGRRFGGTWHVTDVTHTLGAGGLLTDFNVRKTYEGSTR